MNAGNFSSSEGHRRRERRRKAERRKANRAIVIAEKLRRCACALCGRTELPLDAYHFHHIGPKRREVAHLVSGSEAGLREELRRTVMVCSRCHEEVHRNEHSEKSASRGEVAP
jgi:hypothetical protein